MELSDVVETAVLAALNRDELISTYGAVSNDNTQSDDDKPFLVAIKAQDRGDFQGLPGCGIKQVDVETTIEINLGSVDEMAGRVDLLSQLAERVDDLLASAFYLPEANDIIVNLTRPGLKIFGIMADREKRRSDIDMNKERVIAREFICAQIA